MGGTFIYIKDAIEAVVLMIVSRKYIEPRFLFFLLNNAASEILFPENLARANGHIFTVGNPNNEVAVKQLAEMMTQVEAFFNEFAFF